MARHHKPHARNVDPQRVLTLLSIGLSYRDIGKLLGCSYEWARLIATRNGWNNDKSRHAQWQQKESKREERLLPMLLDRRRYRQCRVCGTEFFSKGTRSITCGHDCAVVWDRMRIHDPDYQNKVRIMLANSVLKRPDYYGKGRVEWAKRVIASNGKRIIPDRTWYNKGSVAEGVAQRHPKKWKKR